MIRLQDFSFWVNDKAQLLKNVDIEIEPGEFVIVLGPSGSGKSTLGLCLTGIYPSVLGGRVEGICEVAGLNTVETPVPELATHIGLIFQDPDSQFCNLFVDEEVAFGPENLRIAKDEVLARRENALDQVGLKRFGRRMIHTLSGGQKQRVAIASVLAMGPEILILDQPTANLDPVGKNEVYQLLARLNAEQGKTIILMEHQVDELIQYASRILLMTEGRIIANASPREVLSNWARSMQSEMGLWLPEVTRLALLSEDLGHPMAHFPLSAEDAAAEWNRLPIADRVLSLPTDASVAELGSEPLLSAKQVTFSYPNGATALREVNVDVISGEMSGLMGQNGSGKTTLSLHWVGILRPDKGEIIFKGKDTSDRSVKSLSGDVGYVFQYPDHQFVTDTAADEIAYTPRLQGLEAAKVDRIVQETLEKVGLTGVEDRHPFTLSMGEKRRLSIATMLVRNPQILILDEPTAGLDFRNTQRMISLLQNLRRQGTCIVLVTHTTHLVAQYAGRVVVMDEGRTVFNGRPRELFTSLKEIRTQAIDEPEMLKVVDCLNGRYHREMPPFLTVEELRSAFEESGES